jgi:hypothetical protein
MSDSHRGKRRLVRGAFLLIPVVLVAAVLLVWFRLSSYSPGDPVFDGDSDDLARTVVVPTLDTPLPEGQSAIWCSSFQIAWDRLAQEVAQGPIRLTGADELISRLNRVKGSEEDLEPQSYYAAAGWAGSGPCSKSAKR